MDRKKNPTEKALYVIRVIPTENGHKFNSDILGSYTGTPFNDEVPVQDQDDL